MRKKPIAQYIPSVIDLTLPQQETVTPVEQQQTTAQKRVKPVREKRIAAKVRKTTKTQNVAENPSIKRKRVQQQGPVQQPDGHGHNNGLYQFDLTELIRQKLRMVFVPPMAHSNSSSNSSLASYDPRNMFRRQQMMGFGAPGVPIPRVTYDSLPPYVWGVPNCSQETVPTAFMPRMCQTSGRRFSIFRSVELMAQSSCAPTH